MGIYTHHSAISIEYPPLFFHPLVSRCSIFRRISQFCKKLFEDPQPSQSSDIEILDSGLTLAIIPRNEHCISRKQISENALKVLYRLHKSGFKAYLVGGAVRDLLLGLQPKDYDVVTNATPEEIKQLFRNCRLVGRRFRLAHIVFGRDVIEVATFRGHHTQSNDKLSKANAAGRLLRDNVYGSIDEDAERRDFTVNALYYDISDFSIHSYGGGHDHLQQGVLKLIGEPEQRYREDPVRMLRAVRFATKLSMAIDSDTAAPISQLAHLLSDIPPPRMYEEVSKLFFAGKAQANYQLMQEYGLFQPLFPLLHRIIAEEPKGKAARMMQLVLASTDKRVNQGKTITPAFFYAAILWYPLQIRALEIAHESGLNPYDACVAAMGDILEDQCRSISVPRRFTAPAKDIWQMQLRFDRSQNSRAFKLIESPKFRAAFDLLLLRNEIEGNSAKSALWWRKFMDADEQERSELVKAGNKSTRNRNRTPRKRQRDNPSSSQG